MNTIQKNQLQSHTFASSCFSVNAGQAEQGLLCQWVSRERQQSQKSLSKTALPEVPPFHEPNLTPTLSEQEEVERPLHVRNVAGGRGTLDSQILNPAPKQEALSGLKNRGPKGVSQKLRSLAQL